MRVGDLNYDAEYQALWKSLDQLSTDQGAATKAQRLDNLRDIAVRRVDVVRLMATHCAEACRHYATLGDEYREALWGRRGLLHSAGKTAGSFDGRDELESKRGREKPTPTFRTARPILNRDDVPGYVDDLVLEPPETK